MTPDCPTCNYCGKPIRASSAPRYRSGHCKNPACRRAARAEVTKPACRFCGAEIRHCNVSGHCNRPACRRDLRAEESESDRSYSARHCIEWTDEMDAFIKQHGPTNPPGWVATHMVGGKVSRTAVVSRMAVLGVKRVAVEKPWYDPKRSLISKYVQGIRGGR